MGRDLRTGRHLTPLIDTAKAVSRQPLGSPLGSLAGPLVNRTWKFLMYIYTSKCQGPFTSISPKTNTRNTFKKSRHTQDTHERLKG